MSVLPDDSSDPRPAAPPEPEPWECCQSGCDTCVYDRYWDAVERYEQALAQWEHRHPGVILGVAAQIEQTQ